jgi:hypothetical protein
LQEKVREAREKRLAALAGRGEQPWREIDELIEKKAPRDYDAAASLPIELRELGRRDESTASFARRVADPRAVRQREPYLIARLDKFGLE